MENRRVERQLPHPALALIEANPALFARQGAVVAGWRRRGQRRMGPYYRLRYRDGPCLRTIYLGPEGPLVERVRQALAALQAPWRRRRAYRCQRREIVASLRAHKGVLNRRLGLLGLRLQGYEVRGWRTSPVRLKVR